MRLVGDEAPVDLDLRDALFRAREAGLDLVEMNPAAQPPIVKILNYGRYKYEQERREREARKAHKTIELKELRFSAKIDGADIDRVGRQAAGFIANGHKVKVSVRYRGREQSHSEIGARLLARIVELTAEAGAVEQGPRIEGRFHYVLIGPAKR